MFAARKLQIKREMNAKNYELQLITQAATDAANKVALAQEAQAAAKNQVSIFTSQITQASQASAIAALKRDCPNMDFSSVNKDNIQAINYALNQGSQAGNALASAITTMTDSIFAAQNKAELARLQAQQNSLDMRKGSLETQLKSLEGQYQAAEQAESDSAKSLAPKFAVA